MAEFNILWLDDMHQEGSRDYSTLNEYCNLAREVYDIEFERVYSIVQFKDKIKNFHRYQAVVFDLHGLNPDDVTDIDPMPDAHAIIVQDKLPLLEYVYSGNTHDPHYSYVLRKIGKDKVFHKLDDSFEDMLMKIRSDLYDRWNFYEGHTECKKLFLEGYLDGANKYCMDELLSKWADKDSAYAPYNGMRQILEDMLKHLVNIKLVKDADGTDKYDKFNNVMKNLTTNCFYLKDNNGQYVLDEKTKKKKIDYNNPYVPFSECRREVKYVLDYLCDITNRYSHFLEENPSYLLEDETIQSYNLLIQQSVYPAFFTAMKWYYALMSSK